MALQAEGHRFICRLWKSKDVPWRWVTLVYGWAQPKRFCLGDGSWRYRPIRFHLTPIHFERWGNMLEVGVCIGKRTLTIVKHR